MSTVELLDRSQAPDVTGETPENTLSQEVEQFLEEARRDQPAAQPRPGYMEYRVPFPGCPVLLFLGVATPIESFPTRT